MSASELEKLALCERWRACDPAIHASTVQAFEMDGRLKGGHDISIL